MSDEGDLDLSFDESDSDEPKSKHERRKNETSSSILTPSNNTSSQLGVHLPPQTLPTHPAPDVEDLSQDDEELWSDEEQAPTRALVPSETHPRQPVANHVSPAISSATVEAVGCAPTNDTPATVPIQTTPAPVPSSGRATSSTLMFLDRLKSKPKPVQDSPTQGSSEGEEEEEEEEEELSLSEDASPTPSDLAPPHKGAVRKTELQLSEIRPQILSNGTVDESLPSTQLNHITYNDDNKPSVDEDRSDKVANEEISKSVPTDEVASDHPNQLHSMMQTPVRCRASENDVPNVRSPPNKRDEHRDDEEPPPAEFDKESEVDAAHRQRLEKAALLRQFTEAITEVESDMLTGFAFPALEEFELDCSELATSVGDVLGDGISEKRLALQLLSDQQPFSARTIDRVQNCRAEFENVISHTKLSASRAGGGAAFGAIVPEAEHCIAQLERIAAEIRMVQLEQQHIICRSQEYHEQDQDYSGWGEVKPRASRAKLTHTVGTQCDEEPQKGNCPVVQMDEGTIKRLGVTWARLDAQVGALEERLSALAERSGWSEKCVAHALASANARLVQENSKVIETCILLRADRNRAREEVKAGGTAAELSSALQSQRQAIADLTKDLQEKDRVIVSQSRVIEQSKRNLEKFRIESFTGEEASSQYAQKALQLLGENKTLASENCRLSEERLSMCERVRQLEAELTTMKDSQKGTPRKLTMMNPYDVTALTNLFNGEESRADEQKATFAELPSPSYVDRAGIPQKKGENMEDVIRLAIQCAYHRQQSESWQKKFLDVQSIVVELQNKADKAVSDLRWGCAQEEVPEVLRAEGRCWDRMRELQIEIENWRTEACEAKKALEILKASTSKEERDIPRVISTPQKHTSNTSILTSPVKPGQSEDKEHERLIQDLKRRLQAQKTQIARLQTELHSSTLCRRGDDSAPGAQPVPTSERTSKGSSTKEQSDIAKWREKCIEWEKKYARRTCQLEEELERAQDRALQLQSQIKPPTQASAPSREFPDETSRLLSTMERLERETVRLGKENQRLQQELMDNKLLEGEDKALLAKENARLAEQAARLAEENSKLNQEKCAAAEDRAKVVVLKAQLDHANSMCKEHEDGMKNAALKHQGEVNQLSAQIQHLKSELNNEQCKRGLDVEVSENRYLQIRGEYESGNKQLTQELADARARAAELNWTATQLRQQTDALTQARRDLQELERKHNSLLSANVTLAVEKAKLAEEKSELEFERTRLSEKVSDLSGTMEREVQRILRETSNKQVVLVEANVRLTNEKLKLMVESEEWKYKFQSLTRENEAVQQTVREYSASANSSERFRKENLQLTSELSELRSECSTLRRRVADLPELHKDIEKLRETNIRLESEVNQLKDDIALLQTSSQTGMPLDHQIIFAEHENMGAVVERITAASAQLVQENKELGNENAWLHSQNQKLMFQLQSLKSPNGSVNIIGVSTPSDLPTTTLLNFSNMA